PANVETVVDELEAALRRAVRQRLVADAPVATYLSGGVDSNVLLALARAERGTAPPTFSIGFDGPGTDESTLAAAAARREGSPLTVVRMTGRDVADALPDLHVAAEAPIVDTSTGCMMRLAEAASGTGVKAVLTGEGADEALAGYVWLRVEKGFDLLDAASGGHGARAIRGALFAMVGGAASEPTGALREVRTAQRDVYDPYGRVRRALYTSGLRSRLGGHDPYDDLDLDVERMRRWHPLNRSLYVEYRVMLPGLLLHAKGDRAAMHSGVEARYPFLDDEVIDLCARVAPELKIRRFTEKWLLRRMAARFLPPRAAMRPKRMFHTRLADVVLGASGPAWARDLISPAALRKTGLFDPERVTREFSLQRILPTITPRRLVMDGALTAVVATQLWHHLFLSGGLCDLPTWTAP
ncbi:MAG TPA: asparagine synthase C-terminal domain-containing protein, partial [Polyangiaceae bacterium]